MNPGRKRASSLGLLVDMAAAASISLANILAPIVYSLGSNTQTLLVFRFASFLRVCGLWLVRGRNHETRGVDET